MVSFIYDPVNFFTEQKYREQFRHKKLISKQSTVERPNYYIFGQSVKIYVLKIKVQSKNEVKFKAKMK